MADIEIPFNAWSRKRLYTSQKTMTSRNKRYGVIGDQFCMDFPEHGFSRVYELTHLERVTLAFVRDKFYWDEGCDTEDEFVRVWNDIHPRKKFDDDQKVWLHCFKMVSHIRVPLKYIPKKTPVRRIYETKKRHP